MKIKLALLDSDKNYLSRITTVFTNKYMDKLEIYGFSDMNNAIDSLEKEKIDVFLASEAFEIDVQLVPQRCGFAYLVNNNEIEELSGQKVICKYQKAELVYKQILGIFADISATVAGVKFNNNNTSIIAFYGCSGGVGSSSIAAAYAKSMVKKSKKVLYLNFEKFGSTEYFFSGEGNQTFSDVLYAIKSKKNNLSLKLESSVKTDLSGVYFFESSEVAMDIEEMNLEDFQTMINTVLSAFDYDIIVIDTDLTRKNIVEEINSRATSIVITCDGSSISNKKLMRMCEYFKIIEQQRDERLLAKMKLVYNKFSNKTGKILDNPEIQFIGGVQRYEHASVEQVLEQLEKKYELMEQINM